MSKALDHFKVKIGLTKEDKVTNDNVAKALNKLQNAALDKLNVDIGSMYVDVVGGTTGYTGYTQGPTGWYSKSKAPVEEPKHVHNWIETGKNVCEQDAKTGEWLVIGWIERCSDCRELKEFRIQQ